MPLLCIDERDANLREPFRPGAARGEFVAAERFVLFAFEDRGTALDASLACRWAQQRFLDCALTGRPLRTQYPTCSRCKKRRDACSYGEGVFVCVPARFQRSLNAR